MSASHTHSDHAREDGGETGHAGHAHGLTRSGEFEGVSDSRLLWSVALNQLLTVGQVVGGVVSGSLSLLSDAAHNFNDANALLIAYIARRIARKEATEDFSFGYRRAELIGALINLTTLGVVGLYLIYEAIMRFIEPEPILGWVMAAVAGLALAVDLGTAALLWAMAKGSLNVRAAFIHNITDALGSVAVLIGAGLVIWLNWTWVDPVLTLLIAAYVLYQVITLLPQAARILMEATPPGIDPEAVASALLADPRVDAVSHVHIWQLDEQRSALEADIGVETTMSIGQWMKVKEDLKEGLADGFGIEHARLEAVDDNFDRDHCA